MLVMTENTIAAILKNNSSDPLLSPIEASRYIGVTENTLSVWRCVGRYAIPYIKVGRLVRYRMSDLDAWLESRTLNNGGE
jgi:excisionase family DNA binding protein